MVYVTPLTGSQDGFYAEDVYKNREVIFPIRDPINHVAKAEPASLFFQFGRRDQAVPEEQANRF